MPNFNNYKALLVYGADGWHDGNDVITYSFAGDTLPSYYGTFMSKGQEYWDIGGESVLSSQDLEMSAAEKAMMLRAVDAWNEVANVNLVAASGSAASARVIASDSTAQSYSSILAFADDSSASLDMSDVFTDGLNLFGETFDAADIYVNANGSLTFGAAYSEASPSSLNGAVPAMIAAFWSDIVIGAEGITTDIDAEAGTVTLEWRHVTNYSGSLADSAPENTFSLTLVDQGNGDFDVIFDYSDINWVYEDLTGSDSSAVAGFSSLSSYFETEYSSRTETLQSLDESSGNSGETGVWTYQFRSGNLYVDDVLVSEGAAKSAAYSADSSDSVGDILFGATEFDDVDLYGFVSGLPYDGAGDYLSDIGDLWINENNPDQLVNGVPVYGHTSWNTYLHELGHALGLEHPNDRPWAAAVTNQQTVMSYNAHPAEEYEYLEDQAWPLTPMVWDIQAIQALYGANTSTRTEDNVYFGDGNGKNGSTEYQYATNDDNNLGMQVLGEDGVYRDVILTIWDAGGTDLIDASDLKTDSLIDLRPGHYSTVGEISENIGIAAAVTVSGEVINYVENAWGGKGDDDLTGNAGNNELRGNAGTDTLIGGNGADRLFGGTQDDLLFGENGNDRLFGGQGADILSGDAGQDRLNGNAGDDDMSGGGAKDILKGGAGADYLAGGAGHDNLYGQKGNDTLFGGKGDDTLTGNAGKDTFVFSAGSDVISDFALAINEVIDLSAAAGITGFNDLMTNHATAQGNGVLISDDAGNELLVRSVEPDDLTSNHFLFA